MPKILLLGIGYIGSALYDYLKNDYNVVSSDLEWYGNFVNPNNFKQDYYNLTTEFLSKFDVIILLSGHSSVKMCENNMLSAFKNNVRNFVDLLNRILPEQKLIYASSSSVYGNIDGLNVTEDCKEYVPNNYYDLTKAEIDSYAKLSNRQYFGLRFGTLNGPSPNTRIDLMLNAMLTTALDEKEIRIFNAGIHRPILGIFDCCAAIRMIIEKGTFENRGIYNLASFNSTVDDIGNQMGQILNVPVKIIDEKPIIVENAKLQTKAYNFSISSEKFRKTFDFEFKDTVESITAANLNVWDKVNKSKRNFAQIYY